MAAYQCFGNQHCKIEYAQLPGRCVVPLCMFMKLVFKLVYADGILAPNTIAGLPIQREVVFAVKARY